MPTKLANIDAHELLGIDVGAELRRLVDGQLQGVEQLPTEFVRRALRSGARHVHVRLGRHEVEVTDDGPGSPQDPLDHVVALLDGAAPPGMRHRALVELERSGDFALLAAAGLDPDALELDAPSGRALRHVRGRPPTLGRHDRPGGRVMVRSGGIRRAACADRLRGTCRFAGASIVLGRNELVRGLDGIAERPLRTPLAGRVAIPERGDAARVHLLRHGVVAAQVTVPRVPCFEAALELGGVDDDSGAAALRQALRPRLGALLDQALELMILLGRSAPQQSALARSRVTKLLLQAARTGLRRSEIASIALLPAISEHEGEPSWLSLEDVQALAQRPASGLLSLYPDQRIDRFALDGRPVLILGDTERSLLSELIGVQFHPPPRRSAGRSWRARARRAGRAVSTHLVRAVTWMTHPLRRTPLDDHELTPAQRSLLETLRDHASGVPGPAPAEIRMCEGKGPIRRTRGQAPRVLLPRHNSDVAVCVQAFAHDAAWLYAAYLLLIGDHGPTLAILRARWRRALSQASRSPLSV